MKAAVIPEFELVDAEVLKTEDWSPTEPGEGEVRTASPTAKAPFFPPLNREVWIALALSGIVATIAFDGFGQYLSPAAGFVELAPVALAK